MSTKEQKVAEIVAEHAGREGPLLPILHDVQEELGCVDAESERVIARELNISRADVHGVVSFYHDFHAAPDARPEDLAVALDYLSVLPRSVDRALVPEPGGQKSMPATIRLQEGYDHSYFFISTFMAEHVAWHAERLTK